MKMLSSLTSFIFCVCIILIHGDGGMQMINAQDASSSTESSGWGLGLGSSSGSAYPSTSTSFTTSYPTVPPTMVTSSTGSGSGGGGDQDLPDHGTYWPWDTPRGVLPPVQPATSLNPDYNSYSHYVVWAVSVNDTNTIVPSSPNSYISLTVRQTGDAHYYCARYASSYQATSLMSTLTNYTRAYYYNGIRQQYTPQNYNNMTTLFRLLLQFSYLDESTRIPTSSTASWISSVNYIAARSRMGEFRMLCYYWYNSMNGMDIYHAITNERDQDGKLYWETVKMVKDGMVQFQTLGSRGSTYEHMGAFQWLELPRYPSASLSSYYVLISWYSLSDIRLSRYHLISDLYTASQTYVWNVWYLQHYPSRNFHENESVVALYHNKNLIQAQPQGWDLLQLQQQYRWIVYPTTSIPTSYPYNPYPYPYPYPTPKPSYPYNPYEGMYTTKWNDLSMNNQIFIITYPIGMITAAIIIIIIMTCCMKCRDRRMARAAAAGAPVTSTTASTSASASTTSLSTRFHNLSSLGILLSLLSLILLVAALIVNRFSYAHVDSRIFASYGAFSWDQFTSLRGWLNMYWTGRIFGPITGGVMICNIMFLITNAIYLIKIKRSHDFTTRTSRPMILTCICFIISCTAIFIWLPIHIRLSDPTIGSMIMSYFYSSYNYYYTSSWKVQMGVSSILLIVATGIQLLAIIPMCRLRYLVQQTQVTSGLLSVATDQATRAQQAEQDGLQLVQIGSQYYYRAEPAPMPTPTPYVYGVPASGPVSYAPPVASAPPATATAYYPGYMPPSFQALANPMSTFTVPLSPAPTTNPTPAPVPAPSVYPALPVEVPESGPNNRYQRLL